MYLEYRGRGALKCTIGGEVYYLKRHEQTIIPDKHVKEVTELVKSMPADVFRFSIENPENALLPEIEFIEVGPERGTVEIPIGGSFVAAIKPEGQGFASIEIDHSLESILPEFTVYADSSNPYGADIALFQQAGVTVAYEDGTFIIDYGPTVTAIFKQHAPVTFYYVVKGQNGEELFGSMSPTNPDNTFQYTIVDPA